MQHEQVKAFAKLISLRSTMNPSQFQRYCQVTLINMDPEERYYINEFLTKVREMCITLLAIKENTK